MIQPIDRIAPFIFFGLTALAFFAVRRRSRTLGTVAIIGYASALSGFSLAGWLAIPALVLARRFRPALVAAAALPVALVLGAIIVGLRLPWPRPMPTGATTTAEARVEHVAMVDRIWVGVGRRGGISYQQIPQPFDEVRLQVPATGTAAVTAVDSIDHGSVDSLGMRPTVTVVMPAGNPTAARIAGAQRTWARVALTRFVTSMYAWGAVWAALGVFVASKVRRRQAAVATS